MNKKTLNLYLVTDRKMAQKPLEQAVEQAILGGVTIVQLREKDASFEEFCEKARAMKAVCDKYNIPLIINDNVEVCLAVGASGIHLGASDLDIEKARKMLGENAIIGGSARSVEIAKRAEKAGADYLGVGAVFGTSTKLDAKTISPKILKEIARSVNIPVVAIGGVSLANVEKLKDTGISGVAVVSGILKAEDERLAAQSFLQKLENICKAKE